MTPKEKCEELIKKHQEHKKEFNSAQLDLEEKVAKENEVIADLTDLYNLMD